MAICQVVVSAEVKEVTAIWELYGDKLNGSYKCSNCDTHQLEPTEFCPNCKAKMTDCISVNEKD